MSGREELKAFFLNKLRTLQIEPRKYTYKSYLLIFVIIITNLIEVYYGGMLVIKSDKFLKMATGVKTIITAFQGLKVLAAVRGEDILHLLDSTKHFWNTESTKQSYKLALRGSITYQKFLYFAYFSVVLIPIAFGTLPFKAYESFPGAFWMHALLQSIQYWYTVQVILAVDAMFLSLSLFVWGQFRLLNKRLEMLGMNEAIMYEEAKVCVRHHNFLLRYTERYANMFQYALLVQYWIAALSACVEMFVFTKQDLLGMMLSVNYMIGLFFQLALYCFPADMVIEEGLNTAHAIFNSEWYNHPRLAKIFVVHIIRRSQKEILFRAAGFVDINRVAFTLIFQWSMSLYAVMQDIAKMID